MVSRSSCERGSARSYERDSRDTGVRRPGCDSGSSAQLSNLTLSACLSFSVCKANNGGPCHRVPRSSELKLLWWGVGGRGAPETQAILIKPVLGVVLEGWERDRRLRMAMTQGQGHGLVILL